jgi:hypothetical protein
MLPYFSVHYLKKHRVLGQFDPVLLRECTYFLKYYNFQPIHMLNVNMHNVTPRNVVLYDLPKMLIDVPLYIMMADGYRVRLDPNVESGFNLCYGSVYDKPRSIVTGVFDTGYARNLQKMAMNKMYPDSDIKQELIFAAIISLLSEVGHKEEDRLDFFMPKQNLLMDLLNKYETSPGESPFRNVTVYNVDTGEQSHRTDPPTKRSIASELSEYFMRFLEELEAAGLDGRLFSKVFPGESICRESRKNEIINGLESLTYEELCELQTKLRLFYIEPTHYTMLSHVYLKGIFSFLKGFGFEIGSSLNEGEFLDIWEHHACTSESQERIYEKFPELRPRMYGEGDITRFDQALIYAILYAVGIFFSCFYKYDNPSMVTVMSDIIFRLCTKFLYLVGMDEVKMVFGMMFSGKFETSHGNTAYQNIVWRMYKTAKLEEFRNDPYFYLLEVSIKYGLITHSFSGDDMFLGWPVVLKEKFNFGLKDYEEFCKKVGLYFKLCRIKPLFAVAKFEADGVHRQISHEEGIVFLKNQMARVFEGENYIGTYPYRSFEELVFRIGNSDKANAYLDTFYAKLLSVAYLSVGNTEFMYYLTILHEMFKKKNKNFVFDKEVCRSVMKGSYSMLSFYQQLDKIDSADPFPTLKFLRDKHDEGHEGFKKLRPRVMNFNDYYETYDFDTFDVFG